MAPDGQLKLPLLVVGPSDVARLKREIEALAEYLHQASLRPSGEVAVKLPRTSRMLDDFSQTNALNLLQPQDRDIALQFLGQLAHTAPTVTISFASDPSSAFTAKVLTWFRQNVHPNLLLRVGLQPTIAAGCTLRTLNHFYDFSLRSHFAEQRDLLVRKIEQAGAAHE